MRLHLSLPDSHKQALIDLAIANFRDAQGHATFLLVEAIERAIREWREDQERVFQEAVQE
jgi:hypothetical protein